MRGPGQPFRLSRGGAIDRERQLHFTFDGHPLTAYAGDSLASALLANGVRIVARSIKYHRPRGIVGSGIDEPNALVTISDRTASIPNCLATEVAVSEGMAAVSQNCWPSVTFDLGASFGGLRRFLPPGFYYKTFMWPSRAWPLYERVLRAAAGHGRAPIGVDSRAYDRQHRSCDVLIVGAGISGLAAALQAARSGCDVVLVERDSMAGTGVCGAPGHIDRMPPSRWVTRAVGELRACSNVTLLFNSTAFAHYEGNLIAIAESCDAARSAAGCVARRWLIRGGVVIMATGAVEQPLLFGDNDRPGIMLAGAASTYLHRYGVVAGREVVIATSNDSVYPLALDLSRAGIRVNAVIDSRERAGEIAVAVDGLGIRRIMGARVQRAHGRCGVSGVDVDFADAPRPARRATRIDCDLLCVSGSWAPLLHLIGQAGGQAKFHVPTAVLTPLCESPRLLAAGACDGKWGLDACLESGSHAARCALTALGADSLQGPATVLIEDPCPDLRSDNRPLLRQRSPAWRRCAFVDLQNDVTVADLELAVREGYGTVEHAKRYTTLGMGTDQGRTANPNGIRLLSELTMRDPRELGHTTFRPPLVPISLSLLCGYERGEFSIPTRHTPLAAGNLDAGAVFTDAGLWRRAEAYPGACEQLEHAVQREALHARRQCALFDISTLGKFEICGREALEFLDRVCLTPLADLRQGQVRYVTLLREDGAVFDDGTVCVFQPDRVFLTSTTANAEQLARHLQYCAQVIWPELHVAVVEVTEHWAALYACGPTSHALWAGLPPLPPPARGRCVTGKMLGFEVRICGTSLSGETGFELFVPSRCGTSAWHALNVASSDAGLAPAGAQALDILRIERGLPGMRSEIDGRSSPYDLGIRVCLDRKRDFIGRAALSRPALHEAGRAQLVGLVSDAPLSGASLVELDGCSDGSARVTSAAWSPARMSWVALALVPEGRSRVGAAARAVSVLEKQASRARIEALPLVTGVGPGT